MISIVTCPICGEEGAIIRLGDSKYNPIKTGLDSFDHVYTVSFTEARVTHYDGCGSCVGSVTGRVYRYNHDILLSVRDL